MVITTDELHHRTAEILKNPYKFIVLESEHIKYSDNNDKFVLAIELLNICNSLNYGNELFVKINPEKQINFNILTQAIGCVLKDEPFNEDQLLEYFKIQNEIDHFTKLMRDFTDIYEKTWYPSIDLILLGISLKRQSELKRERDCDLIDDYTDAYELYLDHTTDLKAGIKKIKSKIQKYM
jgi:hypothetical protein